jgi:uncharacterized protein (UPF0305 family)
MVQTISSSVLRRYVRYYMKRVLNEIVDLRRSSNRTHDGVSVDQELLNEKIAFNQMLIEAVENYLSPESHILSPTTI